mgnify:CR=1 FL=1
MSELISEKNLQNIEKIENSIEKSNISLYNTYNVDKSLLTTEQNEALNEMHIHFDTKDSYGLILDDSTYLRYLRARSYDIEKSKNMLESTLKWRNEINIINMNEWKETLMLEHSTGKMYVRGYDNEGHVILYMKPKYENTHNHDGNIKNLIYTLEKVSICMRKDKRQEKMVLIIDYDGFSLLNSAPMKTSMETLNILQNHYPERLYSAYMCRPPWIFNTFWNMIYPFVDPVTKQKIHFIKNSCDIVSTLGEYMNPNQIECYLGGSNDIEFNHELYLNGAMDLEYDEIWKLYSDTLIEGKVEIKEEEEKEELEDK